MSELESRKVFEAVFLLVMIRLGDRLWERVVLAEEINRGEGVKE